MSKMTLATQTDDLLENDDAFALDINLEENWMGVTVLKMVQL